MKREKSNRAPFAQRRFIVSAAAIRDRAAAALANMPVDPLRPLEVVIREQVKQRGRDANALMWAGPLRDIAEQAWVSGQQFRDTTWHEHFKRLYLPEEYDSDLCLDGYQKWSFTPVGERVLIGSTTQLTVKGMSDYLEQVYRDGAELGVVFHANPNERGA